MALAEEALGKGPNVHFHPTKAWEKEVGHHENGVFGFSMGIGGGGVAEVFSGRRSMAMVEGRRGRGLTDGGEQVQGWGFLSALSLVGHWWGGGSWVMGGNGGGARLIWARAR